MQRRYRLKSGGAFHYAYKRGVSVPLKSMVLLYVASKKGLHIGLSVGKSVGNSVTRNHVKRLLRENIRSLIPKMESGFNYIFIARPPIAEMNFKRVGEAVAEALSRAGKLRQ